MAQQQTNSQSNANKPHADFNFHSLVSRLDEKKMWSHPRFEEVTAKYWQMLRQSEVCDLKSNYLSYSVYQNVLVPCYRAKEMETAIQQEWLVDCRGQEQLTLPLLQRLLFRVGNEWAVHFDIDEYLELLEIIYERIIEKVIVGAEGSVTRQAHIHVNFPKEEVHAKEKGEKGIGKQDLHDWQECDEDEQIDDTYDYKYIEDKVKVSMKKYKKPKASFQLQEENKEVVDPIFYRESVFWFPEDKLKPNQSIYDRLTSLSNVVPYGYSFEQFLNNLKTNVQKRIDENKQHNKEQIKRVKREAREKNEEVDPISLEPYVYNKDLGMIEMKGLYLSKDFKLSHYKEIKASTRFTDVLLCYFRQLLRDGCKIRIRGEQDHPIEGSRAKTRMFGSDDPPQFINRCNYNPALERRIHFKIVQLPNEKSGKLLNVNYQLDVEEFRMARRADIKKIETSNQLANKPVHEEEREVDFQSDLEFGEVKRIMLQTKFQDLAEIRHEADEKEVARMKKVQEHYHKDLNKAVSNDPLHLKGVSESFEEKSAVRMTRGPFHHVESLQGLKEDKFLNCAEFDVIEAANTQPLKLLVTGKPRSGKSTLCQLLAQQFDLMHINVENWINALLKKIKEYEVPDDLEEDQEPPKWLTELEEIIDEQLKWGEGPTEEQIEQILKQQIQSPLARTKGFVLDLSFVPREKAWGDVIKEQEYLGNEGKFTYIIDLEIDDVDIIRRVEGMLNNPKFGSVYSKYEITERNKPKIVNEDEEEEQPDDDEEGDKDKGPIDISTLVTRTNDVLQTLGIELSHYEKKEKKPLDSLQTGLLSQQLIKIDAAGLTSETIEQAVSARLRQDQSIPLRPIAIKLEEGGDFKGLLTAEQEENVIPRQWSLWKQTDPVALSSGKVFQGLPEFAASYHNNVFVFLTEENLKEFMLEPKKYLQAAPQMPKEFRLLILGQKSIGKSAQALKLKNLYNWPIYDFPMMVERRLEELNQTEIHVPNNFVEGGRIGLSEQELISINDGKQFPSWKFIPWLLDEAGFELTKRPPPPPEEKEEGEEEQEEELTPVSKRKRDIEKKKKQAEIDKKKKEEDEKKRAKEEKTKLREEALARGDDIAELGLEESEEEIIIDDLPIDDLVLKEDENGNKPFVGGFILLGFPETEEHVNRLKAHGIDFDSVVYLADTNEEDPGVELRKRTQDDATYDFDFEAEVATKNLAVAREFINEDIVKEVSANGTIDECFIRIRAQIDPFFLQADNPDDVRTSADVDEDARKIKRGDFADYCPVTFVKDQWLVKGNPEQEVIVGGKAHFFAGEKELEEFKFNPHAFMINDSTQLPLQPPLPKIMLCGLKGSGVTTQIQSLCEKYGLDEFVLKDEYLKKLTQEKDGRKRKRLLDRGFKPLPPKEDDEEEEPKDPEIEEDADDFDKAEHEKDIMKTLMHSHKGLVIDGSWRDVSEEAVQMSMEEILVESRRLPEVVIHLTCKEENTGKRCIDEAKLQEIYDKQITQMLDEIAKEREEAKKAREEELVDEVKEDEERDEESKQQFVEQQLQEWDEARDQQEEDTEKERVEAEEGPNFARLREEEVEKLKETIEADQGRLDKMKEDFEGKVSIHTINTDISADYVFIKILNLLKLHFERRHNYIERDLADSLKPEEIKHFEQSYNYKQSKFGSYSPLQLSNPIKSKEHVILYRERLYYPSTKEEQARFLSEPSLYAYQKETIPLDIKYTPRVFVHGLPKSGKSTLAKQLVAECGLVHLKLNHIIQMFVQQDSVQGEKLRQRLMLEGNTLDDDTLVKLVAKRLSLSDCATHGYVLEDFPRNKRQCQLLSEHGVVPSIVFNMRVTNEFCYKRAQDLSKFANNRIILSQKIDKWRETVPFVLSFYQRYYNSVREIDSMRSKWFVRDSAFACIQDSIQAKQQFTRNYYLKDQNSCCLVENFAFDRVLCKKSLSSFRYFCPVTWLNSKLLQKCAQNKEQCVLFNEKFYFFKSNKERKMFLDNPLRYSENKSFPMDLPVVIRNTKAAELQSGQKALDSHCPVTLLDKKQVQKGSPVLLINYKDQPFTFTNYSALFSFFKNPTKYAQARLPTKMPPQKNKIELYELQKDDETMVTYMEESVGKVVTQALREVSENRLKYPTLSVKETMLKLFALFLKTMNPANTEFMKEKYQKKMQLFIARCEMPEEINDLAEEKQKKDKKAKWPQFKEAYYNDLGAEFDTLVEQTIPKEKADNFQNFIR